MLVYPQIDPIIVTIGPLAVHWYGMMYLIGFVCAWFLGVYRGKHTIPLWDAEQISDLIFYAALGVVLGGRIGYMMFYSFSTLMYAPWEIFFIWQGGMSFHGGLLGVLLALCYIAKKNKRNFFDVTDFVAPLVPLGLAAGRIGNFINGELWGRVTDVPWAMIFPQAGDLPRHPSQLYEFALEGLLLFFILFFYSRKRCPRMATSGLFLIGYGCFRVFVECFREPDPQLRFIAFNWLTMGQLLSIPMIFLGLILMLGAYKKERESVCDNI